MCTCFPFKGDVEVHFPIDFERLLAIRLGDLVGFLEVTSLKTGDSCYSLEELSANDGDVCRGDHRQVHPALSLLHIGRCFLHLTPEQCRRLLCPPRSRKRGVSLGSLWQAVGRNWVLFSPK